MKMLKKLMFFTGFILCTISLMYACNETETEADSDEVIKSIHEGDVEDSWYDYVIIVDKESKCEYLLFTDKDDQMAVVPRYIKGSQYDQQVIKGCNK